MVERRDRRQCDDGTVIDLSGMFESLLSLALVGIIQMSAGDPPTESA